MKQIKKMYFLIILIILISSCGAPPEGTKEINLLYLIQEQLDKLNEIKNDKKKAKSYFKDLMDNFDVLFVFKKGTSFVINGHEKKPDKDTISHTLEKNQFITVKPVYLTVEKKDILYSLDNKTWYSTKNDIKKEIENLKNDYNFETRIENENTIYIDYTMALSKGENAKPVKLSNEKKVIKLKKGMIFSHTDETKKNTDLTKNILYVPENTLLSGTINVVGNLIESKTNDGIISVQSLKDLYIYFKKMNLSMSFDKEKWNVNIMSFEIEPKFIVSAVEDNEVYFDIYTSAVYNKDKQSMSVAKLLMDAF